jgi:hypothetical protein
MFQSINIYHLAPMSPLYHDGFEGYILFADRTWVMYHGDTNRLPFGLTHECKMQDAGGGAVSERVDTSRALRAALLGVRDALEAERATTATLRKASQALCDKLDKCNENSEYRSVFTILMLHGATDPESMAWEKELNALRAALADTDAETHP